MSAAKDALKSAREEVLEGLVSDFKTKRQVAGRKAAELEDIRKAIVALQDAGEMPLILATSTQMTRCRVMMWRAFLVPGEIFCDSTLFDVV